MQSTSLAAAKGLTPFQASRGRASGGRRRGVLAVRAAAVADTDVNLGALLRDALTTPATPAKPAPAPAPVPEAAPAPAPLAAPAAAAPDVPPAASVTVDPVPGTEILSGAPQPQPPPAPTQGMDFVLEQLQNKPPGYGDAPAAAAKAAAKPLADGLDLSAAGKGLGDAGAAATKSLAAAADGVTGALGGAADSVGSALGGAADAAADAQAAAAAAAAQAAAAAAAAADAARDALTGALGGASGAAAGAAGGVVSGAQQFLEGAASEFDTEVSIIKSNIDSLVGGVTGAVGGATSSVTSQVSSQVAGVAEQVSSLLPPEARDALGQAGTAAASFAKQLTGVDPAVAALLAGVGVGLPALAAWNAAYGGYAGVIQPEEAFEALQTQDALLLDIRSEAQRVATGVAELRKGALGKGAAVPPVRLLPSVAKRVRDPSGVALEIQALEAAALAKVGGGTKVIVMDERGESAKGLARALRAAGVRRPYVLAGGFRGWAAAGLAVRQSASEYDASPLDALSDTAETVVEAAASQLSPLREPRTAALAVAALGGLGFLAFNFHTTLQFIGVLGLELTLVSRALTYDSFQDALDDLSSLYTGAAGLASLPLKAAESLQRRAPAAGQQQQQAGKSEA
ncbi:hypothetical protein ABPG75_003891 [Micractinium tetrahymenae]